ncbi:MAG: ORF6N domain-containing protein [Verrucomicrobiota bacterium]
MNARSKSTEKLPIHTIRGQAVVLDSSLAKLYGATTGNFNKAVGRNLARFPEEFSFVLSDQEFEDLIFQIGRSKGRGGRRKPPRVFTEHGALMASTILNSEKAVSMSVYVIRAFVEMREQLMTNAKILKRLAEIDKTLMEHDQTLWDIYQKLLPLLQPGEESQKRPLGFHADTDS